MIERFRPRPARPAAALAGAAVLALLAGCSGGSSAATASGPSSTSSGQPASSASSSPAGTPASATSTPGRTTGGGPTSTPKGPAGNGDACPSLGLVKATLGLAVGDPAENATVQDVLVCSYPKGGNPSAVIVRIQEKQTAAGFAAAKAGFTKSGQKTQDVAGLFDGAYRSELGSATYGYTRTLVVLRGSTEVLVTARTTFDGLTKLAHTMLD